jgi:hypothetical protein
MKKDRYAVFSKIFAELSEEAQDRLANMAQLLLETHRLAGSRAETENTREKLYECSKKEKPCAGCSSLPCRRQARAKMPAIGGDKV